MFNAHLLHNASVTIMVSNTLRNVFIVYCVCYLKALIKFQSHLLPLSLDNMNTLCLSPSKDYAANRLRSGQLQLSSGTHLTLDEAALNVGMLNTQGWYFFCCLLLYFFIVLVVLCFKLIVS